MPRDDRKIERLNSKTVYEGVVADVRIDAYRRPDGTEVIRQVIAHKGAVAVLAYDEEFVYLVRQPREAVGEVDLLEIPAGLLDHEGEEELEAAKRELREEIGKEAASWREVKTIYPSPGYAEEQITIFEAADLIEVGAEPDGDEQIEIVAHPLVWLADAIAEAKDSKTLVALLYLQRKLDLEDARAGC